MEYMQKQYIDNFKLLKVTTPLLCKVVLSSIADNAAVVYTDSIIHNYTNIVVLYVYSDFILSTTVVLSLYNGIYVSITSVLLYQIMEYMLVLPVYYYIR